MTETRCDQKVRMPAIDEYGACACNKHFCLINNLKIKAVYLMGSFLMNPVTETLFSIMIGYVLLLRNIGNFIIICKLN